ncbi:tetratricopeptide (TPR) repeat protein, partial [Bartonella silvatica]
DKATDAVNETATDAMDKASDVADKATDAVNEMATDAADKASDAADKATDAVNEMATDAMNEAVDAADKAVEALNKAAAGIVVKDSGGADKVATDAMNEAVNAADKAVEALNKVAAGMVVKDSSVTGMAVEAVNKASDAVNEAVRAVNVVGGGVNQAPDVANKAAFDAMGKATDAINKASVVVNEAVDAINKATIGMVDETAGAVNKEFSSQGDVQSQEFPLENQKVLFKDYDLDKLLLNIRAVLEHNTLEKVQKQFHQLFDKKDSVVYSCALENVADMQNDHSQKTPEESDHLVSQQDEDDSLLSSKALYKEGYNFIRSAHYVEAEKAFCAFQQRYKKDPLSDDALFWLAEALLGQKRYHEAAQVYLTAWYKDTKKLYTSEILLKLAGSMVALEQNKQACAPVAKNLKKQQTLQSIFCQSLKRGEAAHGAH